MFIVVNRNEEYLKKDGASYKMVPNEDDATPFTTIGQANSAINDMYEQNHMCGLLHVKRV